MKNLSKDNLILYSTLIIILLAVIFTPTLKDLTGKATELACTDTDGEADYYTKGTVDITSPLPQSFEDYCVNLEIVQNLDGSTSSRWIESSEGTHLSEFECSDGGVTGTYKNSIYECPDGCSDGTCIRDCSFVEIAGQPFEVNTCDSGTGNHGTALSTCSSLGGKLPNINQLETIYNNKDTIGGFEDASYWSSTTAPNNYAWYIAFSNGFINKMNRISTSPNIRCIKDCVSTEATCDDGIDNDCDGLVDIDDTDCEESPLSNVLIEENFGPLNFISSSVLENNCELMEIEKGVDEHTCDTYNARYDIVGEGLGGVEVVVEVRNEEPINKEEIAIAISDNIAENEGMSLDIDTINGNVVYTFIRSEQPKDAIAIWVSGNKVIALAIEDWDDNLVDNDIFEYLLKTYLSKYPSDLTGGIGTPITETTIRSDDPYFCENPINPDWKWVLNGLNSATPEIGIYNNFRKTSDTDNPPGIGECLSLPFEYAKICLDSLTVPSTDYLTVTIEYVDDAPLDDSGHPGMSSAEQAIHIFAPGDSRFVLAGGVQTNELWIAMKTPTKPAVLYRDVESVPDIVYYGEDLLGNQIINYGSTDVDLKLENTIPSSLMKIMIEGDNEFLEISFTLQNGEIAALGKTSALEEADEILWRDLNSPTALHIGAKDEDHRMKYGIIIKNPKLHGASDKVVIEVPSNQVQANIVVKGQGVLVPGPSLGQGIIVAGGVAEDIPIGSPIYGAYGFTQVLTQSDIEALNDKEAIHFSFDSPSIETSLSSSEDDYESNIILEVKKKSIVLNYDNGERIATPLTIDFLGNQLTITDIVDDNTIRVEGIIECVPPTPLVTVECSANTCEYSNTCLPIGTRVPDTNSDGTDEYCDGTSLVNQKAESITCVDNYQCTSNICSPNNRCIDYSTIRQAYCWVLEQTGLLDNLGYTDYTDCLA